MSRFLSSFSPNDLLQSVNGEIGTGIVSPLLKRNTEHNVNKSHVLSFDGKKIVPNSVEIDLFCCGDATAQHQIHLSKEDDSFIGKIEGLILTISKEQSPVSLDVKQRISHSLVNIFYHIGTRLQLLRQLKQGKEYSLSKLKTRKETSASRYGFSLF